MILLVDMDSFFASVEQAHHPHLRGQPVIVCGDPSRRGVVTAASYEARPFGVRAGMPLQEARALCPDAHYVEGNPDKYVAMSVQLLDLYSRFTPDVEPFSVDEAFVGLGPRAATLEDAAEVAREIQSLIDTRFQLGASIGVGPSKLVAKMASGVRKPRGITAFDEERFREHFWPREVTELWGVGPRLGERMKALGVRTVGDLANTPAGVLKGAFGIIGPQLREAAWGRDDTPLVPYHRAVDAKSMGHEVTLPSDCSDPVSVRGTILRLSDQVGRRLRSEGYIGRVVSIKLRNSRFQTRIRQRALTEHTADARLIHRQAFHLLEENWNGEPLRLIGVSVSELARTSDGSQGELFDSDTRQSNLLKAFDRVRDRLGEASLVPAGSLSYRRRLGHVPFGAVSPRSTPDGPAVPRSPRPRSRA